MNSSTSILSNESVGRQGFSESCRFGTSARVGATFVSCALAASLCCISVQDAFGVVLQEDEVLSQSVADRGLDVGA